MALIIMIVSAEVSLNAITLTHIEKREIKRSVSVNQETEEIGFLGVPIWVRTRSSH